MKRMISTMKSGCHLRVSVQQMWRQMKEQPQKEFFIYLPDVLHVRAGVLLQQKELVPHPTSFGAPEWNSIGVLSRQPRGPLPPPCSPPQGSEPVPRKAEVGHDPQHHQYVNSPSIHGHTTNTTAAAATTFCLLHRPLSGPCLFLFRSEYRISLHAVI